MSGVFPQARVVSGKKSAPCLPSLLSVPFAALEMLLVITGFEQFDYVVLWWSLHRVLCTLYLLRFLDLWVDSFNQIWKTLATRVSVF